MVTLGKVSGLEVRARPSAFVAALLMAAGFTLFLSGILKWRPWTALTAGLLATSFHYVSELWHQLGHARAAEKTGFPMKGVTYAGPLGFSVYPREEGLLPAETHIQRAVGGPIFSLLLALTSGLVAVLSRPLGGPPLFLAVFAFLDNLLFFGLGALLPLRFTDGGTLRAWWSHRRSGPRIAL
jgi:Zn-dependent protease